MRLYALQRKVLAVRPFGDIITVRAIQSGVCGKLCKRSKIVPKGTVIAVKGLKALNNCAIICATGPKELKEDDGMR